MAATSLPADIRPLVYLGLAAVLLYAAFGREPARFRAAVACAVIAGAANAELQRRAHVEIAEHRTARYTATLLERNAEEDGSIALTLALLDGTIVSARVRQDVPPPGTVVIVRGRLEPFDESRNPEEPSERDIQRERGFDGRLDAAMVVGICHPERSRGTSCTALGERWILRTALARAHEWAHDRLREHLGEPAASVLAGELWGERAALSPALRTEFQETGTVHVLVTAGLHIGAITALVILLLLPLGLPRVATCGVAIALVWMFVWWSGAQLPAERAAVMATAALAARACGRAAFSWNALALAAILVAFVRPASVTTASFALSFSCVGAIFGCAGPIDRWIEERIALPSRVREALTLTLATQLGTWPVGAAVFLQFAPYAVLANFAVVPCVAATMTLGVAQLALAWCEPLATICANLNSWLLAWMLGVVQTVSALPGAVEPMTPAPAWCIAAYDAALLAAPALWPRDRTSALGALIVAASLVLWPPRAIDGRLRITVLDVGQADAIVIQTPRGHVILVDAGGRLERFVQSSGSAAEEVGERVVVPFLLRHGIHSIDAIVLSHPHGDHAGGVAPVLRRLRVAEFADSGQRYLGHAYQDALATARMNGVPIRYPRAVEVWRTDDGVTLQFIGPSLPFITGSNAINSNSVAFMLQYQKFRMLFTGDAGSESEQRFLLEGTDLRADVLKVGHHGSAYGSSPQFIAAIHPRYAIISVGRHNLFGHPAPSTIAVLRHLGVRVYRTDGAGAVVVTSNGSRIDIAATLATTPGDP
ncbi:MAG TPA: DNA internalization-related competence protein ComEC/Rec2 [Candidatus Cybelea sp.]|nr:DNA internalization-related competence protein ComEC/Rec2 [Candidatus Cybelea sp.]